MQLTTFTKNSGAFNKNLTMNHSYYNHVRKICQANIEKNQNFVGLHIFYTLSAHFLGFVWSENHWD